MVLDTDVAHVVADGKDVNNVRISGAMTRDPAFVDAATSLQEVAELMTVRHYRLAGRRRLRSRRDRRYQTSGTDRTDASWCALRRISRLSGGRECGYIQSPAWRGHGMGRHHDTNEAIRARPARYLS
jgi:hypothetical protein